MGGWLFCACPFLDYPYRRWQYRPLLKQRLTSAFRGKFVWFELVTDDLEKTMDFYHQLLGWEFSTEGDYTLVTYLGALHGSVLVAPAVVWCRG